MSCFKGSKVVDSSLDEQTMIDSTSGTMESERREDDESGIPKAVYINPAPRTLPPLDLTMAIGATTALASSTALPDINQTTRPINPTLLPPIQNDPSQISIDNQAYVQHTADEQKNKNGVVDKQPNSEGLNKKSIYYKPKLVEMSMDITSDTEDDSPNTRCCFCFESLFHPYYGGKPKATLYFKDGLKKIDFVIAYDGMDEDEENKQKREKFENGLQSTGLELEWEPKEESQDQETCFVKVHAPWEVLLKYAEIMRVKMPLKEDGKTEREEMEDDNDDICCSEFCAKMKCCTDPFQLNSPFINEEDNYYTAEFSRDKKSFFDIKDQNTFFSNSERARIAYRIMSETRFGTEKLHLGIQRLISQNIYKSAFPLHEGKHTSQDSKLPVNSNMRRLLYWEWARWGRWYKFQPLDLIRLYLGEKIGMYFAFLGFYTQMLAVASLVGAIVVLFGALTLVLSDNLRRYLGDKVSLYFCWLGFYTHMLIYPSVLGIIIFFFSLGTLPNAIHAREVCEEDFPNYVGNATMCPLCDIDCTYWKLKSSCLAAKFTHLFDNNATIFFAVFMSLWATMFLEFWKRTQFRLSYEWDLIDYDEERDLVRPEFEAVVKKERINPVTQQREPYLDSRQKFSRVALSLVTVLFWIFVIIAAVFAIIVYRLAIKAVFAVSVDLSTIQDVDIIGQFATPQMLTTITASCLSLVVIMILNKIYEYVAIWLTHMELPRTQSEFDDSFTFKMFCFQFVNYYSYLFYVAFFKTTIAGSPSDYTYLGQWRWEECDPGGCMYELSIQLVIIMLGKQIWNNVLEIIFPWALNKYRQYKSSKRSREMPDNEYTRWEQDYDLSPATEMGLFYEYLEMVIQFGFVTLFVAAFPLAPLLALINNIIEIRLDANKFICELRRPLSQKCSDIGAWYYLLEFIATVSVVTNSLTIAITSETIPKLVYFYVYSQPPFGNYSENTFAGYTDDSLSYFDTADFSERSMPTNQDPFGTGVKVTECRYRNYRSSSSSDPKYALTMQYWHVVAGRLAFVIVMEHVVFLLKKLLDYIIPDRPRKLQELIKREHFLVKEMLVKAEAEHLFRKNGVKIENEKMEKAPKMGTRVVQPAMSSNFDHFSITSLGGGTTTPL